MHLGMSRFIPVSGIRDILARIQTRIRGSVYLTNGSGSDPDPTPDPAAFFENLKIAKQFFHIFFL